MRGKREYTQKFKENPFLPNALVNSVRGNRRIYGQNNTQMMIINPNSGEINGVAGFYTEKEVEKNHFVKIYSGCIREMCNLSAAGFKVFMVIYDQLMSDSMYGQDQVVLHYDLLEDEFKNSIGKTSWYNGIKDLIKHKLIAETIASNLFWININYFYRGDRLTLFKSYVLKGSKEAEKMREKQLSLPGMEQDENVKYEEVPRDEQ